MGAPRTPTWLDRLLSLRIPGARRVRRLLRGPYPVSLVRARTSDGVLLALDPDSSLDAAVLRHGYHEREVLEAILGHLPDGGVFWDVGSNMGLHALTVKHLRPDATIIAFEPVPFLAARLRMNSTLAGLDVRLIPVALGAEAALKPMSVKLFANSGLCSLRPWDDVDYESCFDCPVEPAHRLIEVGGLPGPNVMKIDVEGYEDRVLEGMAEGLTSEDLVAVVFESDATRLDGLTRTLEVAGFRVEPLAPRRPSENQRVVNFLATRP